MNGPRKRLARNDRLDLISDLAANQARVLSRRQLRTSGWFTSQIDHEVRVGRWQSPAPGVVVLHNGDLDTEQRLWLGVLHAGTGAVLSHLTATRRAGLEWIGSGQIDVLTPKGDLVTPLPGYFFHQTRRPYARWLRPAAGPPRLPIEHAALLAAERDHNVRRAVGLMCACIQQRLTAPERFLSAAGVIRKLRHGKLLRLALGDIVGGAQSFAELDVGWLCREAGLAEPTRQVVRFDKEGRRRYLDCEWSLPDGRTVVLEVDGAFHMQVLNWWQDMKRERAVAGADRIVLRCSTVELRLEPADVIEDLRRFGVPGRGAMSWAS